MNTCGMHLMSQFTELVRTFAPIVLIVLGWYIINKQNDKRETRKELRSLVDKTQNDIDEVVTQAIRFHTDKYDGLEGMMVQTRLGRITTAATNLGEIFSTDLNSYCVDFRQSITQYNFDKSEHRPLEQNDPIIRTIIDNGQSLSYELDSSFQKKYTLR